ncbi:MAG: ATP-dependent Clp protease adapter ClpS [Deltaproteobacteria bacterium]|nr:ATP-dependent Clp protease adapter ClpS [Deltaproteobacteria bacterium]
MPRTKIINETDILTEDNIDVKEPPMYRVILLNDDYTSMDFVLLILKSIFRKSSEEATRLMLTVHNHGSATAGLYTKEVAETKIAMVHQIAREHEFPLKCQMEPI